MGINGNVVYSINGGRGENNNWEVDGGDNMDNGSNNSLNVYPSIDADPGSARAHFQLRRAIWPQRLRHHRGGNQIRHQPVPWRRVRIQPQQYFQRPQLLRPELTERPRNTRRTTSVTPLADRSIFRGITTATKAKPSFSGRRNGARKSYPIRSRSRCLRTRSAAETSPTFARSVPRIARQIIRIFRCRS